MFKALLEYKNFTLTITSEFCVVVRTMVIILKSVSVLANNFHYKYHQYRQYQYRTRY